MAPIDGAAIAREQRVAFRIAALLSGPDIDETRAAPTDPATAIRSLVIAGCTPIEAGNLAALSHGLRPVRSGWTARQIQHLRFLRTIVGAGHIEP
jgi:hypothetical protein